MVRVSGVVPIARMVAGLFACALLGAAYGAFFGGLYGGALTARHPGGELSLSTFSYGMRLGLLYGGVGGFLGGIIGGAAGRRCWQGWILGAALGVMYSWLMVSGFSRSEVGEAAAMPFHDWSGLIALGAGATVAAAMRRRGPESRVPLVGLVARLWERSGAGAISLRVRLTLGAALLVLSHLLVAFMVQNYLRL